MQTPLLNTINSPKDLKKLDYREMEQLCSEIRAFLIEKVSKTGGHLSSNLGMVELTVALHRVLNSPQDKFVFDVGHQCYTHKLLTGRRNEFDTLRQAGGLSGFPRPSESEHDIFQTGHGSTALSAASGIARAKKLKGEPGFVVAIIGDGAFTGGMVYEAINNLMGLDNLIIILNDNKMSISKNVGAMAHYFTELRTSPAYYKAKNDVKYVLDKTPVIGQGLKKSLGALKATVRRGIYHSTFFEEVGCQYIGPVDGHNLVSLCSLFISAREIDKPLFIHVETTKGKGFTPAEQNPGAFHGVSSFEPHSITDPDLPPGDSFSTQMGQQLAKLGKSNNRICAITAAMKYGTGLQYFKKEIPHRFFDVGMAEEHAVTFAAGLAQSGMLPVVCIYSTFMQRAYDQLIHDVMLQNLDVLFAIDRAGLVPGDGETHQGIYDAAYFSQQRNLPVISPSNYAELHYWMTALTTSYSGPRVIRYPRGQESSLLSEKPCSGNLYDCLTPSANNSQVAIVTYGAETEEALVAIKQLEEANKNVSLWQMVQINPVPADLIDTLKNHQYILFAEEGIASGGIGEHFAVQLYQAGFKGKFAHIAIPETGVDHATVAQLREQYRLDAKSLANRLMEDVF